MSSMDSVLLVAASTLFKNMVRPWVNTATEVQWTRIALILLAILAAAAALDPPGDIVEITIFSGSLYAVCFLPAVLIGLHWRRGNALAVLLSMAGGVLTLIGWIATELNTVTHEVFPALAVSIVLYVITSLSTSPEGHLPRAST